MHSKNKEILFFFCGFVLGYLIVVFMTSSFKKISSEESLNKRIKSKKVIDESSRKSSENLDTEKNASAITKFYDESLADKLYNEVKILCWVFTHPDNHKKKVPYVRQTWGRRCNKLLFMSIEADPEHADIIAIPVENGRAHLWNKTRLAMKYVYENYINDYDWFMRADDDNYIVMENLRYKLSKYHPQTAIYIGHRFSVSYDKVEEGYMAGGGHIFSQKALTKFVTYLAFNGTVCQQSDSEMDDVLVGQCLRKHAIFIDARDDKNQKQIFPVGVDEHLNYASNNMNYWYWRNLWRNVTQGGLDCCSDVYIGSHYVPPKEMYLMEYIIYHFHPFGLQKNLTEILPRKYSLNEIVAASDAKSIFSPNYKEHERIHYFEDDEKYSKK